MAIEPNLQAAFIDYGTEKNGFLAFSEIHPEYYRQDLSPEIQNLVDTQQWKKLSISDVMAKGQEMLVQVVKEEVGKKGANMTTYLSVPGRCVVLMPGSDSEGVSRKISGEERREGTYTVIVADNGSGVAEADRQRIFEHFGLDWSPPQLERGLRSVGPQQHRWPGGTVASPLR